MCRPGPPAAARVLIIGDSVSIGQMKPGADYIAAYMAAHAPSVTVNHGPYCGDGGALDSKYGTCYECLNCFYNKTKSFF